MGSIYILSQIKLKYGKQRSSKMIHVDEDDPVGELEPSFPHRDVTIKRGKDAEESYELLSEIGRGKFGTVYHCKEKATGLELAAKFVGVSRREERRNVEREVDIMRQLQHPRLIQLYDAYDNGKTMCVILELITGGELFERVIDDDFVLTEKACTVFMRQICEGIEFVHQQNILHLDMKPENILCLTKTGNRIKIIDFGLARKFDPTKKLQVLFGTPEFVAPEVVNFDQIGFGTDMWSIGVICYVLLSGLSPFMGETDIETMANVTIAKYDFDDEAFNEISDDAKDFIKQLLIKDKQSRMTAQQCVAHKWLQKRPALIEDVKKETPQPVKPVTKTRASPQDELDVAKENLRLFVERWSEHPNSPYLFDVATHEITPCMSLSNFEGLERSLSQQSIGGCSPSPCGSISSLPEYIENEIFTAPAIEKLDKTEYDDMQYNNSYHNLERRASDSSCMVNKKADVSRRVNLAEEIKKLSERLYVLSTMNTDLVNNNVQTEVNSQVINEEKNSMKNGYVNSKNHSSTTALMNKETKTTTTSNKSAYSTTINEQKYSTTSTFNSEKCTQKITNTSIKNVFENKTHRNYTNLLETEENGNNSFDDNLNSFSNQWNKKKFKISNFSRDVPLPKERKKSTVDDETSKRVENGNGIEKTATTEDNKRYYKKLDSNGDVKSNANNTKDLLLHLLDEWGESQSPPNNYHAGRHKSVSMEWSESESLASKSMNSVNTFFKKQSSTSNSSTVKKKQEAFTSDNIK